MENYTLLELCYEIIPNENKNLSIEKWNSLFPKLMELRDIHSISAMPKDKHIDLTIAYRCSEKSFAKTIKTIEERLEDNEYQIYFTKSNYVKEENLF